MEHKCQYCGAPLPEDAAFCPCCAKSQITKKPMLPPEKQSPRLRPAAAAAVCAGVLLVSGFAVRHALTASAPTEAPETEPATETTEMTTAATEAAVTEETAAITAPIVLQEGEVLLHEEFPGKMAVPEASFVFPEGIQEKLAALDFDYSAEALAVVEEVWDIVNTDRPMTTEDNDSPDVESAYFYILDGEPIGQKITFPDGSQQFFLYRDLDNNIWACTILLAADGSRQEAYFYSDGSLAASFRLNADSTQYSEGYFYPNGTQSYMLTRKADQELAVIHSPHSTVNITVTAGNQGTEYSLYTASGTMLQHYWYYPDGSIRISYFENGSFSRNEDIPAGGTEPAED